MNKKYQNVPAITDPSDICNALVGLKNIRILFYCRKGPLAEIAIELIPGDVRCSNCGSKAYIKDRPWVRYVDLPFGGTPNRIAWRKHRMICMNLQCNTKSWTLSDHRIAALGCMLTTRAAKWVTRQVGIGRTISEVADELQCSWGVINKSVQIYGQALLAADRKRLKTTTALGFDETLFYRHGQFHTKFWCTTIADVTNVQLIDLLPSRNYVDVARWVKDRPSEFKENIIYGALDMSNIYAAVFTVMLPKAIQVVDRFHLIRLANHALDSIRRRTQNEQLGHRGRKSDPLYKARKLLIMGSNNLDEDTTERLRALLELGDPKAEVALAYTIKEAVSDFYEMTSIEDAIAHLTSIIERIKRPSMPLELQSLGNTIKRWFDKIVAYHLAKVTNGPTEGLNNLIKRVKRVAFGFTNFENYRIRALLYAGKPNWRVLDSIVVR